MSNIGRNAACPCGSGKKYKNCCLLKEEKLKANKAKAERVIEYLSGKKQRYERRGQCVRCGVCCLKEECEHFVDAHDGQSATCKIFGKPERPSKCTDFPYAPPIMVESCGYYYYDHLEERVLKCKEMI